MNTLFRAAEALPKVAGAQIAAGIVYKNRFVSIGFNEMKTHPMAAKYGRNKDAIYLHAEVSAIRNAIRHMSEEDMSRATLYVARVKKDRPGGVFIPGNAKPCIGCARAIAEFNLARVVYSHEDGICEIS